MYNRTVIAVIAKPHQLNEIKLEYKLKVGKNADFIGHYHWQHEHQPILMKEKGHWNERSENNRNATFFDATMSAINIHDNEHGSRIAIEHKFAAQLSFLTCDFWRLPILDAIESRYWRHLSTFSSIIDISANI